MWKQVEYWVIGQIPNEANCTYLGSVLFVMVFTIQQLRLNFLHTTTNTGVFRAQKTQQLPLVCVVYLLFVLWNLSLETIAKI